MNLSTPIRPNPNAAAPESFRTVLGRIRERAAGLRRLARARRATASAARAESLLDRLSERTRAFDMLRDLMEEAAVVLPDARLATGFESGGRRLSLRVQRTPGNLAAGPRERDFSEFRLVVGVSERELTVECHQTRHDTDLLPERWTFPIGGDGREVLREVASQNLEQFASACFAIPNKENS
ncbi:MAG: hypothetical protein ACYTCU_05165 [Planctomycetota bacterium]|jgi:hypothetical protein